MNGLSDLVYTVTQQEDLLEEIIADPSLLAAYANLTDEQIEAFFAIVKNKELLTYLQTLPPHTIINYPYWWDGGGPWAPS